MTPRLHISDKVSKKNLAKFFGLILSAQCTNTCCIFVDSLGMKKSERADPRPAEAMAHHR